MTVYFKVKFELTLKFKLIIPKKNNMSSNEDYDRIFEQFLAQEMNALFSEFKHYLEMNHSVSNNYNLNEFNTLMDKKGSELLSLKPTDHFHKYDHFIEEIISTFPYRQHEFKYKFTPIQNFFNNDLIKIRDKFNNADFPYHFNKELFNASPKDLLKILAQYFAIKDFTAKADTVKILEKDRPEKVIDRIKKSTGKENLVKNKNEEPSALTSQQVLTMYFLFEAIGIDDKQNGVKESKYEVISMLTGKNVSNIKKVLSKPLKFKTSKKILEDIEIIKLNLLKLQNNKITQSINNHIFNLKKMQ